ncbi:MAG TPA: alpha/beta hydrolase-fold protein [Polyangiaceae bacterium]|nr:alpha/beta hydrolase-fold protein [Polyangiaceae bacterium]
MSRLSRRSFFSLGVAWSASGFLRGPAYEEHELEIAESAPNLSRCVVALPILRPKAAKLPIAILLHGLGETRDPKLGVRAWLDAYGLRSALDRLDEGHLRGDASYQYLSADERYALNDSLHREPFQGLCIVCPFLPNPHVGGNWQTSLLRYAIWATEKLLPAVRREFPDVAGERVGLAGVSLGGFSALEVYLQRPTSFQALGSVQGAFSKVYARAAAQRLLATGQKPAVYAGTSTFDPYRVANVDFARAVEAGGGNVKLNVRNGPHSQAWLREIGTLDTLIWLDRALR